MASHVLNLSRHEFTQEQCEQLRHLVALDAADALVVHELLDGDERRRLLHLDLEQPLGEQCAALVDAFEISAGEWNSDAIFLVPPDLGAISAVALTYIHGIARFPILVWRSGDPRGAGFRVAGVLDLRTFRDGVRRDSLG